MPAQVSSFDFVLTLLDTRMNRIRSPIPELYRSQASTLSTSASAPDLRKFHRISVSIQPDEDPFSPTTHEVAAAEAAQADSDDDWARVSEDSIGFNELGEAEGGLGGQDSMRRIGRKPSFLKDLWDRRLSRSSSVSSLQSVKAHDFEPNSQNRPSASRRAQISGLVGPDQPRQRQSDLNQGRGRDTNRQ